MFNDAFIAPSIGQSVAHFVKRTLSWLMPARLTNMNALYRQRRDLADLDARMLNDIGVSPAEAAIESARPIWHAPSHWKAHSLR